MKRNLKLRLAFLAMAGFIFTLGGCSTVPKGATRTAQITAGQLQASGAGIISADTHTVTFCVKCDGMRLSKRAYHHPHAAGRQALCPELDLPQLRA